MTIIFKNKLKYTYFLLSISMFFLFGCENEKNTNIESKILEKKITTDTMKNEVINNMASEREAGDSAKFKPYNVVMQKTKVENEKQSKATFKVSTPEYREIIRESLKMDQTKIDAAMINLGNNLGDPEARKILSEKIKNNKAYREKILALAKEQMKNN